MDLAWGTSPKFEGLSDWSASGTSATYAALANSSDKPPKADISCFVGLAFLYCRGQGNIHQPNGVLLHAWQHMRVRVSVMPTAE